MGGIKWIKSESFYFNNIEGMEFSRQILDGGTSLVNMVTGKYWNYN